MLPHLRCGSMMLGIATAIAFPAISNAAPLAQETALADRLGQEIQERFDQGDLASLQVAVSVGDELLWSGALGYADLEHQVPAGPETIYRIASVTKQFTAARLLQQIAEGEMGLEDDVRTELEDLPTGGHPVSVRQLLNHTSGIPSYTDLGPTWVADMGKPMRWKGMLELLDGSDHIFEPGTDWAYNNSAYFAAGELIAELGRGGFRRQIEKELLAPLGLEHTSLEDHSALIPNRARGYKYYEFSDTFRNALYMHPSQPGGAGALLSNCEDLVDWKLQLMAGDVLPPELLSEMTISSVLADGREPGYGFGLALGELHGVERWHHSGGIFGASSFLAGYPEADLAIALVTNVGDKGLGPLELELAQIVLEDLGLAAPEPVAQEALSETQAAVYLGRYVFNGLAAWIEWDTERGLVAKFQGQRRFELRPIGGHAVRVFADTSADAPSDEKDPEAPEPFSAEAARDLDVTLVFEVDETGVAQRCTLLQRGSRQTGVRDPELFTDSIRADLAVIGDAIDSYAIENAGHYPASLEELSSSSGDAPAYFKASFVGENGVPNDPWKRPYRYEAPNDQIGYRIYSLGRDGLKGGEGEDRDVSNLDEESSPKLPVQRSSESAEASHLTAQVRADLAALESAIQMYAIENAGQLPKTLQDLVRPQDQGIPYLKGGQVPNDPWGVEYRYEPPTDSHPFRVYTLGEDKLEGGTGVNSDLSNADE